MAFKKAPEKAKINPREGLREGLTSDLEKKNTTREQDIERGEKSSEKRLDSKTGASGQEKFDESSAGLATNQSIQNREKERLEEIEKVLEENLDEVYAKMDPSQQQEFRKKGEETASRINILLKKVHVSIKKIASLIKKWLKVIPGINKFFLEQEAKIKADKIIKIKNDKNYE